MEWQEAMLPVLAHAAAMVGDNRLESRARIAVMDKNRRISTNELYRYSLSKRN